MTYNEMALYSTVKLVSERNGASFRGTGFFMHFAVTGDKGVLSIVTNKHMVRVGDRVSVVLHVRKDGVYLPSGELLTSVIDITPDILFDHPDPEVDLCAVAIQRVINQARRDGKELFYRAYDLDWVPPERKWKLFDVIEDITMPGYPRGISDEVNNLPLVRRGITATSVYNDYNGKAEFMVDIACFPGSSGSPVILHNDGGMMRKTDDSPLESLVFLLGILYAGPQITASGQVVLAQPPEIYTQTTMHLGVAIRSSELWPLDEVIRRRIKEDDEAYTTP